MPDKGPDMTKTLWKVIIKGTENKHLKSIIHKILKLREKLRILSWYTHYQLMINWFLMIMISRETYAIHSLGIAILDGDNPVDTTIKIFENHPVWSSMKLFLIYIYTYMYAYMYNVCVCLYICIYIYIR